VKASCLGQLASSNLTITQVDRQHATGTRHFWISLVVLNMTNMLAIEIDDDDDNECDRG
jgi:hypothetical protein